VFSDECINGGEEEAHPELVGLEDDVVGNNNQEEEARRTVLREDKVRLSMNGGTYLFNIKVLESMLIDGTKDIHTKVSFCYGNSNKDSARWVIIGFIDGFVLPQLDSFGSTSRSEQLHIYIEYDDRADNVSRFSMGLVG
jgi:hypothetical protein